MRRSSVALAVAALGLTAPACGGGQHGRFALTTPEERRTAEPLPEVQAARDEAERIANYRPSQRDAERVRPVLKGWGDALARDDYEPATRYFAVPVIVAQQTEVKLETAAQVRAFNAALPCGARLLSV